MIGCVIGVVRRTASRATNSTERVGVSRTATYADVSGSIVIARVRVWTSSNTDTFKVVCVSSGADVLTLIIDTISEISSRTNQNALLTHIISEVLGIITRRLTLVGGRIRKISAKTSRDTVSGCCIAKGKRVEWADSYPGLGDIISKPSDAGGESGGAVADPVHSVGVEVGRT